MHEAKWEIWMYLCSQKLGTQIWVLAPAYYTKTACFRLRTTAHVRMLSHHKTVVCVFVCYHQITVTDTLLVKIKQVNRTWVDKKWFCISWKQFKSLVFGIQVKNHSQSQTWKSTLYYPVTLISCQIHANTFSKAENKNTWKAIMTEGNVGLKTFAAGSKWQMLKIHALTWNTLPHQDRHVGREVFMGISKQPQHTKPHVWPHVLIEHINCSVRY